jgi:hypothetical protein
MPLCANDSRDYSRLAKPVGRAEVARAPVRPCHARHVHEVNTKMVAVSTGKGAREPAIDWTPSTAAKWPMKTTELGLAS